MSYIQIEIGGKLRGLKFSQGTLILFEDSIKSYDEAEMKAFASHKLVWAALKTNCMIKGEEVEFTFADVFDWVESLTEDVLLKIHAAFNESQGFAKDLPEDKKKVKTKITKKAVTG